MHSKSNLRSPMKRVRGLGAAHEGTHHFWLQRLTALAMVPLSLWFIIQLVNHLIGADLTAVQLWFKRPEVAIALLLFVGAMIAHARLGIQVIIEDYVHCEAKKIASLIINNALSWVLVAATVFSIARLHFGN